MQFIRGSCIHQYFFMWKEIIGKKQTYAHRIVLLTFSKLSGQQWLHLNPHRFRRNMTWLCKSISYYIFISTAIVKCYRTNLLKWTLGTNARKILGRYWWMRPFVPVFNTKITGTFPPIVKTHPVMVNSSLYVHTKWEKLPWLRWNRKQKKLSSPQDTCDMWQFKKEKLACKHNFMGNFMGWS